MKKIIPILVLAFVLVTSLAYGQDVGRLVSVSGSPERGDIIYRSTTGYSLLKHSTAVSGILTSGGHAANPSWLETGSATDAFLGLNASGTLEYYTNLSLGNTDAQFYDSVAPTKLVGVTPVNVTAGVTTWYQPVATTGPVYLSTPALTAGTYVGLLEGIATGGLIFGDSTPDAAGEIGYDGALKYYNTALRTVVSLDETQTLTNKTLTTPTITNPEIDAHLTADWTAIPANVSNTMIHNCGQAGVAATITLPTGAAGYAFIATVCEPSLTGTWKFLCSGTDHMTVDEVKGKHYVERLTTKVQGDSVTCWTAKQANDGVSSTTTLSTGSTVTAVANTAFKFVIAGVGYDKAADAVGIAPEAVTTAQNKYGGQMLEIGVDGVIHANAGANCAAGFDTEAAAAADADAHAVTAAHVKIGTVTAMRTNVAGFVWGTTGFDDADTTETFHSQAVHTFGYGWNCKSGKTPWTTD